MKRLHSRSGLPLGIHKLSEIDLAGETGKNTALSKMLQTREVRQTLSSVLPDVLTVLAKDSKIGKFIMKAVGKLLTRLLTRPHDIFEKKELQLLFEDETFIRNIGEPLPEIINGLFDIIVTLTKTIEEMPAAEKKEVFGDVISKIATGQTGEIITWGCRIINDIHKEDPEFFTNALAPGFQKWVESVDFGEIREMFDTSAEDGRAFVKMANEVMWQYPAKVVMLLSLLPSLVNLITDTLDISVGKLNELPPDMLTDVVLSFAREINTDSVANVLNQLTEIVRKIHTGSALLGEPGAPQLPKVLSKMIEDIVDQTDPITLWKAKIALAETKATIDQAVAASVSSKPNFKHLSMIMGPEITNIRLKSLNTRMAQWDAEDDEEMAKSFAQHLAAYDLQEIGEVINNALRIINRIGDEKPAIFTEFAAQLTNAIDDFELAETAKRFFNGVSKEFKPIARAVVPGLVTWICDVIKPEDDEYEDDAARARDALRSLFATEEV
jgi:phage host-nuclease inhibitor protein Gam